MFQKIRTRRLRLSEAMRRLASEHVLVPHKLVLPIFVGEGLQPRPIPSMPGVVQHSIDSFKRELQKAACAKLGGVMLFGIPDSRSEGAEDAFRPDGILNKACSIAVREVGDSLLIQTDLCLDEFTQHGHCGVVSKDGSIDNDATLEMYAEMALAQAAAGSQMLGLSGCMDGQTGFVREVLDSNGNHDVSLVAYSAKYASALYGPFRHATNSPFSGSRKTYQLNPANLREAIRKIEVDISEGADALIVKPAGYYLDVLRCASEISRIPVMAYQVSGEYAMIKSAAAWTDTKQLVIESLLSIHRAGADAILTYWALDAASWLSETF
ncbi:porphobilinogen synthase [Tropheryma whipplei]|nr:porphobilinogen synthase [Tropheryma whipplei]MCO8182458.1 porphobilinogen synthase [Tropheryma whipplei]MCO8190302.1 porphobilinogen synthase [Tropheryma whipplei]CAD67403.1 delta-aminolevulinic acid dehydratase [Tropheryma whipplei TW08/27]